MKKTFKTLCFIIFIICIMLPIRVFANIVCNDGTVSPSCVYNHNGCCSWHGGVRDDGLSSDSDVGSVLLLLIIGGGVASAVTYSIIKYSSPADYGIRNHKLNNRDSVLSNKENENDKFDVTVDDFKFAYRCKNCGKTYDYMLDNCPFCNNDNSNLDEREVLSEKYNDDDMNSEEIIVKKCTICRMLYDYDLDECPYCNADNSSDISNDEYMFGYKCNNCGSIYDYTLDDCPFCFNDVTNLDKREVFVKKNNENTIDSEEIVVKKCRKCGLLYDYELDECPHCNDDED